MIPFLQRVNPRQVFAIQNSQYYERLILEDDVPAASPKLGRISISAVGHFYCMFMTGSFSTLGAALADTGISYLKTKIIDSTGSRNLCNDRIPLDLLLTPGRRKDANSAAPITDPDSNSLFYPMEFEYMFAKNTDVFFDTYNSSVVENHYEVVLHGYRVTHDGWDEIVQERNQVAQMQLPEYGPQPVVDSQMMGYLGRRF